MRFCGAVVVATVNTRESTISVDLAGYIISVPSLIVPIQSELLEYSYLLFKYLILVLKLKHWLLLLTGGNVCRKACSKKP